MKERTIESLSNLEYKEMTRYKNLPDESVPDDAEHANIVLDNVDYLKEQVDNLKKQFETVKPQIGSQGINLLKDSATGINLLDTGYPDFTKRENGKITILKSGYFDVYTFFTDKFILDFKEVEKIKNFTMSVDVKTTGLVGNENLLLRFDFRGVGGGTTSTVASNIALLASNNDKWTRYSCKLTIPDGENYKDYARGSFLIVPQADYDGTGVTVEYKNFKIEAGIVDYPLWTPSYTDYMNEDSGWINITPVSGTWEFLKCRKIGNEVTVAGRANKFVWNGGSQLIGTIPAGFRIPSELLSVGTATNGNIIRIGISPNGNISTDWLFDFVNNTLYKEKETWVHFNIRYFID